MSMVDISIFRMFTFMVIFKLHCISWIGVGFCQKPFLKLTRWLCSFCPSICLFGKMETMVYFWGFYFYTIFILLNLWKFYTVNFHQLYPLSPPTLFSFRCHHGQFLMHKYSWMVIFHKGMGWLSDFALLEKIDTSLLTTET